MKAKRFLRTVVIVIIISSNIGCDQISKKMVRHNLDDNERIDMIYNHLILTKIENTGAFLSLGDSLPQPINRMLLTILPLIILGFTLIYLLVKRNLSDLMILGFCFILGGGFGNIFDRVIHGSVTDFLHIDFIVFHTGIFNMADVSIMTGMFIILCEKYFNRKQLNFKPSDEIIDN